MFALVITLCVLALGKIAGQQSIVVTQFVSPQAIPVLPPNQLFIRRDLVPPQLPPPQIRNPDIPQTPIFVQYFRRDGNDNLNLQALRENQPRRELFAPNIPTENTNRPTFRDSGGAGNKGSSVQRYANDNVNLDEVNNSGSQKLNSESGQSTSIQYDANVSENDNLNDGNSSGKDSPTLPPSASPIDHQYNIGISPEKKEPGTDELSQRSPPAVQYNTEMYDNVNFDDRKNDGKDTLSLSPNAPLSIPVNTMQSPVLTDKPQNNDETKVEIGLASKVPPTPTSKPQNGNLPEVTLDQRASFDGDKCPTGYIRVNGSAECILPD